MKVSIIGAGNVGAQAAQMILRRNIADVVLIDIVEGLAQGKALDLAHSAALEGYKNKITGTADFDQLAGSKIVVITAGFARKPGESRSELLAKNSRVVREVLEKVISHARDAIIMMVTNPLDAMTYLAYKISGLERRKVLGMAGILDTARFKCLAAERLGVSCGDVESLVLGEHGDTMVILPRFTFVMGEPICSLLPADEVENLLERAKGAGAQIVSLLKQMSASYAPGSAIACMVEAILTDSKTVAPASVYLDGEYGMRGLCIGVPVKLGIGGAEEIIELKLDKEEQSALFVSAEKIRQDLAHLQL